MRPHDRKAGAASIILVGWRDVDVIEKVLKKIRILNQEFIDLGNHPTQVLPRFCHGALATYAIYTVCE